MATGTVSIAVDGSDDEIRSLANWLRDEDDLRGRVNTENAAIQEDRMGGALESVVVILSSGTAATLFSSVKDWLVAKKSAGKITMKVSSGNGRELELSCGSTADMDTALVSVHKFLNESP